MDEPKPEPEIEVPPPQPGQDEVNLSFQQLINKHLGKSLTGQSLAKLEDLSKILDRI